jgi:hypothetical protein
MPSPRAGWVVGKYHLTMPFNLFVFKYFYSSPEYLRVNLRSGKTNSPKASL